MKRATESGEEVERSRLLAPWGGVRRRSGFTVLLISECCKLTGLTPAWFGRWRAADSYPRLRLFVPYRFGWRVLQDTRKEVARRLSSMSLRRRASIVVSVVSPFDAPEVLGCYLVDPASSHMLVSKIKPCMSKYELIQTVKLRMAH
jgi:hypothetical protein